jgi:tetratricopeptide (TPR) repeat protein
MCICVGEELMKPMGSITMHYPFLEEESRDILVQVMANAWNYRDFVLQLAELVYLEKQSYPIAYVAVRHAANDDLEYVDKIVNEYADFAILKPWHLAHRLSSTPAFEPYLEIGGTQNQEYDELFSKSTRTARETQPPDWMLLEMILLEAWVSQSPSPERTQLLEYAEKLTGTNFDLKRYSSYILELQAWDSFQVGHLDAAIILQSSACDIAKKNDDQVQLARVLSMLGNLVKNRDLAESMRLLALSDDICERLDLRSARALNFRQMGLVSKARGEYDDAIKYYLESIRLLESLNRSLYVVPQNLAFTYNFLGDSDEALEWATLSLETTKHAATRIHAVFRMSEALSLLGRLDEAAKYLDQGRDLALKSGSERSMFQLYTAEGFLDRALGNPAAAMQNWERALMIARDIGVRNFQNYALLQLARTELNEVDFSSFNHNDISGLWLFKLEQDALEHDLPGMLVEAYILKARVFLKMARTDEALKILNEALKASEKPGLAMLRARVLNEIELTESYTSS